MSTLPSDVITSNSKLFLRAVLLLALATVGLACGAGSSLPSLPVLPTEDGGALPPGGDGGSPDAGAPPLTPDSGSPGNADGGMPLPPVDGGTPTPPADGGTPAPPVDGGTTDGGFDPASYDPRFVINRSGDPACAGIGPSPVPTPTRIVHAEHPGSYASCYGPWDADGRGDVAVRCLSTLPERGWHILYTPDGKVSEELNANRVVPLQDGFATAYYPFGPPTMTVEFKWFDRSAWKHNSTEYPSAGSRDVVGLAWRGALVLKRFPTQEGPPTTQWYDSHGAASHPPRTWPGATELGYAGVDVRGNALVTWRTAEGSPLSAQWLGPDDATIGPVFTAPELAPDSELGLEPLIGGGLVVQHRTVLLPNQSPAPAPGWLTAEPWPLRIVNGGKGYAFAKTESETGSPQCQGPTVTVRAPNGATCATVNLVTPASPCGQPARLGIDGTLMQSLHAADEPDPEIATFIWRWWPGLFR